MTLSPTGTTGATGGRRGVIAVAAAAVVLLVIAAVALFLGFRGEGGQGSPPGPGAAATSSRDGPPTDGRESTQPQAPQRPSASTPAEPAAGGAPSTTDPSRDFLGASQPTRIAIPSIGLTSTTFVDLTVQQDGTLSVPGTEDEVGLYQAGPTPGQLGPAVLGAHVDSPEGRKGIFWSLGKVRAGDAIDITREDGTTATFTVDRVKAYPKAEFPTDLVYKGDFTRSEIRLVTCGGPVDSQNEYRDNVVVFGHLTSTT
ncbi:sortase domain-bontaining protein [Humibacillus xanthopallidus]|uniref:sortase domain-containing protein n=1 Tax=Humibacillus xanthopallidus TaxID=412689 RepID=UPI00384CB90C